MPQALIAISLQPEKAKDWFEALQTGERSQTAMMTLAPDDATGDKAD